MPTTQQWGTARNGSNSADVSIHIPAGPVETRRVLARFIVRPQVSLGDRLVDRGDTDTVVYRASFWSHFHIDPLRTDSELTAREGTTIEI